MVSLSVLILPRNAPASAITYINRAEGFTSSGTSVATAAASHTTGNFLAVYVQIQSAGTPTVTDTAGNTYTQAGAAVSDGVNRIRIFYAYNITGNASNVVTANWSGASTYNGISVRQFSGIQTSSNPLDDNDEGTGNSANLATPSLTLSGTEGLIFAGMTDYNPVFVAGSGFTLNEINDGFGGYMADEYKIVTASEAATASNDSGTWLIKGALFKSVTPNYGYVRKITIDHTKVANTDQTDFPVLFSGTYSYLATVANGGVVRNANGYDIGFYTNSNCTTGKMAWELETYSATTGAVNYWVKVPTLATATDTVFYLCYGDAGINSDQSLVTSVWNSSYKGVWHMADGTTFSGLDSTENNSDSSNNNSTTAVVGQIDGAGGFNGSSNWLDIGTNIVGLTGSFTLSTWVYVTTFPTSGNNKQLFYFTDLTNYAYFQLFNSAGTVQLIGGLYPGGQTAWNISGWSTDTWHLVTCVYNGSTAKVYFDGVEKSSSGSGTGVPGTMIQFRIGAGENGGPLYYFTGRLDEARASNSARGADWITTEYNNQSSPSTFYTSGAQQPTRNAILFGTDF